MKLFSADRPANKLIVATNTIEGNEWAWGLFEIHEPNPQGVVHRYQIIQVVRSDVIAEWRRDMGPASKFKGVNQIRIPSLMLHTVDELMDLADELRGRPQIDVKDFLSLDKYKPA